MKSLQAFVIVVAIVMSAVISYHRGYNDGSMAQTIRQNDQLQKMANNLPLREQVKWGKEPMPIHRTGTPEYWQKWCEQTYGKAKGQSGFRQQAMDWSDHCTEAGDAK